MIFTLEVHFEGLTSLYPCQRRDIVGSGGRRAVERHPVLFPEHYFVISGPIDLKLGSCVCCNNTECCVKRS